MKFIVGLLTGLVLGAVGAVAYSVQTGRDLREEYAGIRGDIDNRDFEALGNRLEARLNELQATFQDRANQIQASTSSNGDAGEAIDKAKAAAGSAVDDAKKAVDDAADTVADAASDLPKA
jgi:gas vesicle protein